jgi:hydroxypyruvate isomerase
MNRRDFLATGIATAAACAAPSVLPARRSQVSPQPRGRIQFDLAPHFGMFRHHAGGDLLDQIKFLADNGFTALEDSRLLSRPFSVQDAIRRELDCRGMRLGAFVATQEFSQVTFASGRRGDRHRCVADVRRAVKVARRMDARWCSIVPGKCDPRLPWPRQAANAVAALRDCMEICEPAGVVLLLEPLDRGVRSPRLLLENLEQTVRICREVNSPSCKVLFHTSEQAAESAGALVTRLDAAWTEIGYVQIADAPGGKEPGTGTLDFTALFTALARHNYAGIVGLDHGNSQPGLDGERAVIAAYPCPSA